MEARIESPDFVALSRKLNAAGQGEIRKRLVKDMRRIANPVRDDFRSAVRGLSSNSVFSGGARARAAAEGGRARGRSRSLTEKDLSRVLARRSGLRDSVARGVVAVVRDNGNTPGIYITARTSQMPEDQRSLPRAMNNPSGWRHPVFGNRDVWVQQTATPAQWWRNTARKNHAKARQAVEDTVRDYTRYLAN